MTRSALEIEDACTKGISFVKTVDSGPYKKCVDGFRWRARTSALGLVDASTGFQTARRQAARCRWTLLFPRHPPSPLR